MDGVCYQLSALKCGDDQFDPSLSILCMMSSYFTTSMTIIGVIKGEVDKNLEFHEMRARWRIIEENGNVLLT